MESVDKRWYVGYSWYITIFAAVMALLCIAGWAIPAFTPVAQEWGWTGTTFGVAIGTLLFRVFYYPRIAKTQELSMAGFQYAVCYLVMIINLLHLTGWIKSWYLVFFVQIIVFAGLYGTFTILGVILLITMYIVLAIPEANQKEIFTNPLYVGVIVGAYLLSIGGHFFWKTRYIDAESQKVNRLSGMLKSKQQQSEILIQSIADGVIVTDTKGAISLMNPAAATMTQWKVEEAINIDVRLVVKLDKEDGKPLAPGEDPFNAVFAQKKNINQTMSLLGREGKQQIVSLVVSPVILPKTNELVGCVAVLRDISEERKVEKQRADFISTASHEMRTPVAAIEGYLALAMNNNVSKIDAKAREYLEKAHSSTQHLGKLFQDLLTSAKAEDGRLTSHPIAVDMSAFTEQLAEDLRFGAQKKGLDMEFIVSNHEGSTGVIDASGSTAKTLQPIFYTLADPDRIREVITNVFDNAVKYTEQGKITLALTGNDDLVQISVKDTGPGIPAEDLPHLFQKFYRVDNSATRAIGGTGLGLFICKKIVELYNGRIWAESTLGQGTTFFINLPRISAARAAQLQQSEKSNNLA